MKQWSLVLAVVTTAGLLAGPAPAQQQRRPGGGLAAFTEVSLLQMSPGLATRLGLNAEQTAKINTIREQMGQELRGLFQPGQGRNQEAIQKLQALRQKGEADAAAVLTPEQNKKWGELKAEQEPYRGLGRAGTGLIGVEGLTPEQKQKLGELAKTNGAKLQELRAGLAQGDRQAVFQKIQEMDTATQAEIRKALTPDQVKQYDAALPQLRRRPGAQ